MESLDQNKETLAKDMEIRDTNKGHKSFPKLIARGPTLCSFCLPGIFYSASNSITLLHTSDQYILQKSGFSVFHLASL